MSHFKILEKALKDKIKKILIKHKIFYFMPSSNIYGKAGVADFICCISGCFVAIETKTEKGKQTELQKEFEKKVLNSDGTYLLVRPTMINYFEKKLLEIIKHKLYENFCTSI